MTGGDTHNTQHVLIPLAEGCEELEAVTLIDLLRRAEITVTTAALGEHQVTGAHGIALVADTTLDQVLEQTFDMIVLPGGLPGADYLEQDMRLQQLLKHHHQCGALLGAVCAAPQVLLSAGLLKQRTITAYPGLLEARARDQDTKITTAAVVKDGNIITSKGPGTAMDFALEIIAALKGNAARSSVEDALVRPA